MSVIVFVGNVKDEIREFVVFKISGESFRTGDVRTTLRILLNVLKTDKKESVDSPPPTPPEKTTVVVDSASQKEGTTIKMNEHFNS